ncbi:transmembrane protein 126A-like [Anguilla rostrata]|uniref:transmembrane protein 126A-like n=1 Tax=Anguilla rostrata TaxID=7938 RepID=UPI0030D1085F
MSETNEALNDMENLKPKSAIMNVLLTKFERLPDTDKKLFAYGPIYLGMNGAFSGLIANSFFRRVLKVSQGWITSSLPMAVLPFLSTVALYQATISQPLLSGNLDCKACAEVRGALLGVVVGGLYPVALALPVNAGLASRYNTTPMPEKGKVLQFMVKITKPVLKKMSFVVVLQAICGYYLSSLQYRIYRKAVELPSSDSEDQEAID